MRYSRLFKAISALGLIAVAGSALATPTTYTRTVRPVGNGVGIARIASTEVDTSGTYSTRYVSGSGICSAYMSGQNYRVNGVVLDFGTVAGGANANDIVGFYFTFNPNTPDTLNVWRNLVGKIDSFATGNIRSFGFGGVTQTGKFAVRMDGYSGGINGYGLGIMNMDTANTKTFNQFTPDDASVGYTFLGGGGTNNWTPPSVGQTQNLVVSSNYNNFQSVFRPEITGGSGDSLPHGYQFNAQTTRGSAAINDSAKIIAFYTYDSALSYAHTVRVYKYTDSGSGVPTLTLVGDYDFKDVIAGMDAYAVNYHSQAGFRGPQQISINDNGDIAFAVGLEVDGSTAGGNELTQYRAIVMLKRTGASSYAPYKKVFYNNDDLSKPLIVNNNTYFPAIAGVAIDNNANVFFSGCNWMDGWNNSIVTTNAIYRAKPDNASNPTSWTVEPVVWRGMKWVDGSDKWELTVIPNNNSGQDWIANPAAFSCTGINRTTLPGNEFGGFLFGAGAVKDVEPSEGNEMQALYVAPTAQTPDTTTIAKAKTLTDGDGVNLYNCVVLAFLGDYTPDITSPGKTYYRYLVADSSYSRIVVSTIRNTLSVGDKIHVSGEIWQNASATDPNVAVGEKYLSSTGLVLLEKGVDAKKPVAMTGKTVGGGFGLDTTGMWVVACGKVESINTASKYFDINDGSGPVRVNYGNNTLPSGFVVGSFVSVSGDVTGAKAITMEDPAYDGYFTYDDVFVDSIIKY